MREKGYISAYKLGRFTKNCLDSVESGESFFVTRGEKVVAEIRPVTLPGETRAVVEETLPASLGGEAITQERSVKVPIVPL